MRQKKRQQLDMRAELDTATGRVRASIDAVGGDDTFENGLSGHLDIRSSDAPTDGAHSAGETRQIALKQTAPGRYEADFPLDRYGAFSLHASLEKATEDAHGAEKSVTVAESFGHVTNPYPREYLALQPDLLLLSRVAEITGGRVSPEPREPLDAAGESVSYHEDLWPRCIAAAIVVFLLDLLVRRVRLLDRKRTARPAAPKAPKLGAA
jgi:hypothetical protein